MLDATVKLVSEKALTIDAKIRLGIHQKSVPINQLFEEYTDTFMNRSGTSQDELRAVATKCDETGIFWST